MIENLGQNVAGVVNIDDIVEQNVEREASESGSVRAEAAEPSVSRVVNVIENMGQNVKAAVNIDDNIEQNVERDASDSESAWVADKVQSADKAQAADKFEVDSDQNEINTNLTEKKIESALNIVRNEREQSPSNHDHQGMGPSDVTPKKAKKSLGSFFKTSPAPSSMEPSHTVEVELNNYMMSPTIDSEMALSLGGKSIRSTSHT
ncbi:hypothetical protein IRJ41_005013 [Triplophysa rosa]|uniref:Uncharacterized protein n=1 Tax=Triplophysa rosa TaxID=992332 RepID=A0A9W7T4V3_TRIRA|nr:hypothetical protein IRJ41_005013 [Triplophysa rosa]